MTSLKPHSLVLWPNMPALNLSSEEEHLSSKSWGPSWLGRYKFFDLSLDPSIFLPTTCRLWAQFGSWDGDLKELSFRFWY